MACSWILFLCFVLCACLACCESQECFFELIDSGVNEVIFIGEKDIVMRCGVKSSQSAYDIKIEHNGRVVAYSNGTGRSVNYTITEVRSNDGGNYYCRAVNSEGTTTINSQKQLHLNVHDRTSPQCFRNGTTGVPVKEGDLLLMSCYCPIRAKNDCRWQKTVEESGVGILIPSEDTTKESKTILRITFGPIKEMDSATRFDCFSGSSASERCFIGGTVNSSKDMVLNFPTGSGQSVDCFLDSKSSPSSPLSNTTALMMSSKLLVNHKVSSFNVNLLGLLVPLFGSSLIVLSLIFLQKRKRNRKNQIERQGQSVAEKGKNKDLHYDRAIFTIGSTSLTNVKSNVNNEPNEDCTQDSSSTYEREIHQDTPPDENTKYDEDGYHVYQELKY